MNFNTVVASLPPSETTGSPQGEAQVPVKPADAEYLTIAESGSTNGPNSEEVGAH